MHHFFVEPENIKSGKVIISGSDVRHITSSLRLDVEDEITVADGAGNKYLVELSSIEDGMVIGEIKDEILKEVEARVNVTLVQGLPKSKKMDLIVQKCTELGINEVIPVETKRTVVKLKDSKAKRRVKRWQKIAKEAAKQSGRAQIPKVRRLMKFKEIKELLEDYDLVLIPWEDEVQIKLKDVLGELKETENTKNIMIIIGPEGGFSSKEVELVKDAGAYSVTLGSRILRTETAGIVATTMVLYELGDLG